MTFEIPESWVWTSIGELFEHNTGKALNASNRDGKMMDYITTSNLYWDRFDLSVVKQMLFTEEELWRCTAKKGDLLICEGGDIGRAAIWNYDYDIRIQNHIHRLRGYKGINHRFYYFVFLLYKLSNRIGGKGVAIQGLSSGDLHKLEVPLPPEYEQIRLLKTIEKWFKFVDLLEQEQENLHTLVQSTKSKILDLAISGKLVPQDPNDEPAIELLKRINPNFQPCDNSHYENLPQGWVKAGFKDIYQTISSRDYQIQQRDIINEGLYPVVSQSSNYIEGYYNNKEMLLDVTAPVLIFGDHTRVVKYIDFPFVIGADGVKVIMPFINDKFAYYLLLYTSQHIDNKGYSRHFQFIAKANYCIPPLREQTHIVKTLETLFEIIDTITAEL